MRRHRLLLLILLAVVSLFSISGLAAQDQTSPLQVLQTYPLSGQELELRADILLYFDRPLDCATASAAVSISPAVAGDISCAGDTLRFTPGADYTRATAYTLTVSTALRAADGAALAEAYTLTLTSVGFLQVSQVLPAANAVDVVSDALVTVIFNRPVVPLLAAEELARLPSPITIAPQVRGSGEWLNTSIYVFRPESAFAGGVEYTVTVAAGLQAVDGSVLPEDYAWSFSVVRPAITEVFPAALQSAVLLDTGIQVRFNQPMNTASVESAFALMADGAETAVSGTFEWADDQMGFMFQPDALLQIDTVYTISIYDEVAEGAGGGSLSLPLFSQFSTVPLPAIVSTYPNNNDENVQFWGSFDIYFASPMDTETFEGRITIDPAPEREPDLYYSEYSNYLSVSFPAFASTTYTITIAPGMADIYGNIIDTPLTVRFTSAPIQPSINLQVPGSVGFYNAARQPTQLFLTHINVNRIDLQLYSVALSDFIPQAAGQNYYDVANGVGAASDTLLRRWSITSSAPPNVYRYELLDLGAAADSATACPGALPSRVRVGDVAVVITEPDPVRARSAPPDGEIVELLYRDYRIPIVGGPQCFDGMLWWEVRLRDERTAWVAEGLGDEYFIDVQLAAQTTPVAVSDESGRLAPGIYLLNASSAEIGTEFYQIQRHVLVVATANLVMKTSVDSVLIWATDVQTGQVIADAPITVYDSDMNVLAQGSTDANGLLRAEMERTTDLYVGRVAVLQTDTQFGIAVNQWTNGIDPWQFGANFNAYPQNYRLYVYTDRPVYRPGQPVYFRGVVRAMDDVTYTPSGFATVPVVITNDQGEVVYQADVAVTPFGTFSGQFDLDPNAALGYYSLNINLPVESAPNYYGSEGGSVSFGVAEYRLPEYQVTITPEQAAVEQGGTVRMVVEARYFFGGAVSNAQVDYNVVSQPYYFNYTGQGFYNFFDFDSDSGPSAFFSNSSALIASGSVTTDAQGRASIEVPADLGDNPVSQTFTVEAVVIDESQQGVAGRASAVVHQGLFYIGAAPADYVGSEGEDATFNFVTVDWQSNPLANQTLEVEIVERRWSSVQEQDDFGRTTWTYEVEDIPVTSATVTSDSSGRASFTFTPPNGGIFRARASSTDASGNQVSTAAYIWIASSQYVSWRQQNSNRIDLVAGQTDYNVGDTAEILITSPFQGTVEALVTVERGNVLLSERITMESNSYLYRLPITPDFAPNVYVSVVIVKGVDENNSVAAFRMGLLALNVNNEQKRLTIEIAPDREQAGPGDTVSYTVRVIDYAGNPVQAEVGVALTDLASLSIAPPNSPLLLYYFYVIQGLGVRTATPLTINTDQLTQETIDTIKGGGGGFGEGGIFDIREQFIDTAFWNATLVTNAEGTATFAVTLPDNLTTWRLDARAVTSGEDGLTLVGQNTFDIISTKPLLIRPVTPRFFVVGDQVTLAAVVNNNTGEDLSVRVTLQGTGITFLGEQAQMVTVAAGARVRIEWPVTVDDVANVELLYFADGNDGAYSDASRPPLGQGDNRLLPVYRYEVPETVGTGGILREEGARTEAILLPRQFEVTEGTLTLNLEPSLAATTLDGLDYLENFPHQCTEQTISRFLPNIMTFRALESLGVADDDLRQQLAAAVGYALQRLYAEQKVDGGWGWFVQDVSNSLTTAYALIGLVEARNQGFAVEDRVISAAQFYLRTQFITPDLSQPTWALNRQAFVLYALARSGGPDVARTVTLFEQRARLDYYARAFLAQTFALIDANDNSRSALLVSDLLSAATLSANGAFWDEAQNDYWNWNSDTRTTAIALQALLMLNPQSDLIPNVVRWLMIARRADAWETTQETAWAVMALTDWMLATGELNPAYSYAAALNGTQLTEAQATPASVRETQRLVVDVADLLADEANRLVIRRGDGAGVLYYTAYLTVSLPVPEIQPLTRGITVERRYTLLDDEGETPITQGRVGDVVQVRLTIIAPSALHYVVIEDPLPAGSEGINPNLTTSQQIGTQPGLDLADPLYYGWGWWYFSSIEFRDERVVLYSTYLPAGTYEYVYTIRLGLAGTYNVIPAVGYQFYLPEVYGRSAGSSFTILPLDQ
ncbi:MAG: Ig-like domain-containing protein [Chloroflexi bacterium]|nr:Ig-like domain-containing protein [Chloroflexota bacterium]